MTTARATTPTGAMYRSLVCGASVRWVVIPNRSHTWRRRARAQMSRQVPPGTAPALSKVAERGGVAIGAGPTTRLTPTRRAGPNLAARRTRRGLASSYARRTPRPVVPCPARRAAAGAGGGIDGAGPHRPVDGGGGTRPVRAGGLRLAGPGRGGDVRVSSAGPAHRPDRGRAARPRRSGPADDP